MLSGWQLNNFKKGSKKDRKWAQKRTEKGPKRPFALSICMSSFYVSVSKFTKGTEKGTERRPQKGRTHLMLLNCHPVSHPQHLSINVYTYTYLSNRPRDSLKELTKPQLRCRNVTHVWCNSGWTSRPKCGKTLRHLSEFLRTSSAHHCCVIWCQSALTVAWQCLTTRPK